MAILCTTPIPPTPRNNWTDQDLLVSAKNGDETAFEMLLRRYEPLVRSRARSFFLQGADNDDIIQEGMIGFFKAVRDFDFGGSSFRTFANICVTRQIITAVKMASRQKHEPLNCAFSLNAPAQHNDSEQTVSDKVGDRSMAFDVALVQTAEVKAIMSVLRRYLSTFEYRTLLLWLEGRPFVEIAHKLQKRIKSVDNGIWRVKCKIRRLLQAGIIPPGPTIFRDN